MKTLELTERQKKGMFTDDGTPKFLRHYTKLPTAMVKEQRAKSKEQRRQAKSGVEG